MKFRHILLMGGTLLAVYKTGKIVGGLCCLVNMMDRYGDGSFKGSKELVCQIGKHTTISVKNN